MAVNLANGTGRRKTSVARVYLRPGSGKISINGKELGEYFVVDGLTTTVKAPLVVTNSETAYDVLINVKGGGFNSQADACRHGLSRALVKLDESNRPALRQNDFLRRDSRMVVR